GSCSAPSRSRWPSCCRACGRSCSGTDMDGVTLVVALLMLLGLAGALLPFLPGTPLILAGALVHAIATGFDPIGPWRLAILAVLALLSAALGWLGGAIG